MTPAQQKALKELRESQVNFPPLFDMDEGKLGVVLVESFSAKNFGLPTSVEMAFVTITPTGQIAEIAQAVYVKAK